MKMVMVHAVTNERDAKKHLKDFARLCKKTHFGKIVHAAYLSDKKTDARLLVTTFKTTRREYKIIKKAKGYFIPVKGVVFPVTSMKGGR